MRFSKQILALFVLPLMLQACGSADDENSFSGAFQKGFDESWNKEFVNGCVTESESSGAPLSERTEFCSCLADELGKSLDGMSEKMNPPEAKLNKAADQCAGNMGLGE